MQCGQDALSAFWCESLQLLSQCVWIVSREGGSYGWKGTLQFCLTDLCRAGFRKECEQG